MRHELNYGQLVFFIILFEIMRREELGRKNEGKWIVPKLNLKLLWWGVD